MSLRSLEPGQRIIICGDAGICFGRVASVQQPPDLLSCLSSEQMAIVIQTMRELSVDQIALIEYDRGPTKVAFAAVHDARHEVWADLRGQPLQFLACTGGKG